MGITNGMALLLRAGIFLLIIFSYISCSKKNAVHPNISNKVPYTISKKVGTGNDTATGQPFNNVESGINGSPRWELLASRTGRLFTVNGTTCWRDKEGVMRCIGAYWGIPDIPEFKSSLPPIRIDPGKQFSLNSPWHYACFLDDTLKFTQCWPKQTGPGNVLPEITENAIQVGVTDKHFWAVANNKTFLWYHTNAIVFDSPVQLAYADRLVLGLDEKGTVSTGKNNAPILEELAGSKKIDGNSGEICGLNNDHVLKCRKKKNIWIEDKMYSDGRKMYPEPVVSIVADVKSFLCNHRVGNHEATCVLLQSGNVKCWDSKIQKLYQPRPESPIGIFSIESSEPIAEIVGSVNEGNRVGMYATGVSGKLFWADLSDEKSTFVPVSPDLRKPAMVEANQYQICLLSTEGDVFCGQMCTQKDCDPSPDRLSRMSVLKNIEELSMSPTHMCALSKNDQLFCWGENTAFQLGSGHSYSVQNFSRGLPSYVQLPSGEWRDLLQSSMCPSQKLTDKNINDIYLANYRFIWALGNDGYVRHASHCGCACNHEPCKPDDSIECLNGGGGSTGLANCGDMRGDSDKKTKPPFKVSAYDATNSYTTKWIRMDRVKDVVAFAGDYEGVDMLNAKGQLWRWRVVNPYDYTGDYKKLSPKNIASIPAFGYAITKTNSLISTYPNRHLEPIENVLGAAIVYDDGCAVKQDGTVWCWGDFKMDQHSWLRWKQRYTAKQVPNLSQVVDVGLITETSHMGVDGYACALKKDGTVWCWSSSQRHKCLGKRDEPDSNIPAKVLGVENATKIFLWHEQACAASGDKLLCWGENILGPKFSEVPMEIKY